MFYQLWLKLKNRNKMVNQTIETPEEKIEVGGISDSGAIYEKEVRPMGNEPLYKQVKLPDKEE